LIHKAFDIILILFLHFFFEFAASFSCRYYHTMKT